MSKFHYLVDFYLVCRLVKFEMTTYSISLDDVDLGFLPLRAHKFNDFLKKEYYQFEVVIKDDIEEPVPTIFYKCHVCDIEVPTSFASEHGASIKHRANARIASVAMQRAHKLVSSLPLPISDTKHSPSGRFCENCVILADENHDKTKAHRVAVMHDNLLWDLMKAYVGNEGLMDDCKSTNTKEDHDDIRIGDHQIGFENVGNSANIGLVNKETSSPGTICHNDTTEDKESTKTIDNNRITPTDAPLAQETNNKQSKVKTKRKAKKQNVVTSNSEIICNMSLEKCVSDELTNANTRKNESIITTKTELNHANNEYVVDASKNQNTRNTQEINKCEAEEHKPKNDIKNKTQSISKLNIPTNFQLNEACKDITDEIRKKTHANEPRNFNDYDSWNTYTYFITNEIYTYTLYESELRKRCNKNTNSTSMVRFKLIGNEVYVNINDDVHLVVEKDNFNSYKRLLIRSDYAIECLVCDIVFEERQETLHTNDTQHMNKISNIGEDDNYIRKFTDAHCHCILCNITLHHKSVAKHKQDRYHLRRKETNIFKFLTDETQPERFKVFCPEYLKAIGIETTTPVIYEEDDENDTNDNVDSEIDYPYEDVAGEMRCVICDCRVPRDLQNRFAHINGSKHMKNMKKLKNSKLA